MNWCILIVEAAVLAAMFNLIVFISLYKNPVWWIHDYPQDIQEEYFKSHQRIPTEALSKNVVIKKGGAIIIALIVLTVLLYIARAKTFSQGFLGAFFIWFIISALDCFFMDWILFANIKAIRLPGTEHMNKEYHQKKYHFIRGLIGLLIGVIPCLIVGGIILIINL